MPYQPAWFHRLDEILAYLLAIESTHLDRPGGPEALPRAPAPRTTDHDESRCPNKPSRVIPPFPS